MAAPGGKTGGRVSIRVIPDATKFRNDLKLLLKRVEQSMSANLAVVADTRSAEATLRRFQRDWNGQQVGLTAAVTTAGARAQLAYASRPRTVPLIVRVSQASVKRAATIIASLAGARLASDMLGNIAERLQNLDRALPKLAAVSLSIASLGGSALAAVGGLFTLGSSLASVLGLAIAAPGILAGMAVGATVLGLALYDTGKVLADLGPDFVNLKTIASDNFWGQAAAPIRAFVNSVLPGLQAGLAHTSIALGKWTTSVVESFQKALGGGVIDGLFFNLVESINIASTGTAGFANALVTLGAVGSAYLPRLAQWVADLSNRFNEFISAAAADGRLTGFIEAGIVAAQQLGSVLGSLVGIWAGISNAAEMAGGGGLATLADVLNRVEEVVNSTTFQQTLATIFTGASGAAAGLASSLGPIGDMLTALAPTISQILSSSGDALGLFLSNVAAALSQPAFAQGLTDFFAGIQLGLAAIGPSLPAIATAFGAVASFAGVLASVLGPVLSSVLVSLAPILVTLLEGLKPVVAILGTALVDAVLKVAPAILTMVEAIVPLLPMLLDLAVQSLPGAITAITTLATVLQVLLPFLEPLLGWISGVVEFLSSAAAITTALTSGTSMMQVATDIINGQFGPAMQGLTSVFVGVFSAARSFFEGLINGVQSVASVWATVWAGIQSGFASVFATIVGIGRGAFNGLMGIIEGGLNGIVGALNGLLSGVRTVADGLSALTGGAINFSIGSVPKIALPRLATGGDVLPTRGGTAVLLGEGGRRETVTDYGRTNQLIDLASALASRALSVGGGGEQNFYVTPPADEDPRVTARVWAREFSTQGG